MVFIFQSRCFYGVAPNKWKKIGTYLPSQFIYVDMNNSPTHTANSKPSPHTSNPKPSQHTTNPKPSPHTYNPRTLTTHV